MISIVVPSGGARRLVLLAVASIAALAASVPARQNAAAPAPASVSFAGRIAALSEPGGFFNTDNLISNERSFLQVAPELRALGAQAAPGSTYLGVGPDQNFSYIAQLRPSLAVIIDIRRDNLLLHLLFKALFAEARTRVEYLALLTGRTMPPADPASAKKPVDAVVAAIDAARPMAPERIAAMRARLTQVVNGFGVPLTDADRTTIDSFHRRFIAAGLALQFNTSGRAPQFDYPTYRDLLLETDRAGTRQSFMATEDDFQFVKQLEAHDAIVPIVGDLAGPSALASVGRFLAGSNRYVSAFYTSNVEFYLFRDGSFPRFMANLGRLPHRPTSVIIRSIFPSGGTGLALPPGYNSASLTQPMQALIDGYAKGLFRQYWELAGR